MRPRKVIKNWSEPTLDKSDCLHSRGYFYFGDFSFIGKIFYISFLENSNRNPLQILLALSRILDESLVSIKNSFRWSGLGENGLSGLEVQETRFLWMRKTVIWGLEVWEIKDIGRAIGFLWSGEKGLLGIGTKFLCMIQKKIKRLLLWEMILDLETTLSIMSFGNQIFKEGDFETRYLKILEKGLIGNIQEHIRLIWTRIRLFLRNEMLRENILQNWMINCNS